MSAKRCRQKWSAFLFRRFSIFRQFLTCFRERFHMFPIYSSICTKASLFIKLEIPGLIKGSRLAKSCSSLEMPVKFRRISKRRRHQLLACFARDVTATQAAQFAGVNRNTANDWYGTFRVALLAHTQQETPKFSGEIELDESYFGGPRKKLHAKDRRKRGRGAENKVPVFGVLKRDGRVYTQIIKNASKQELLPIVRQLVRKKSTIYTDKWASYDGLVFDGYKHKRINHSRQYSNRRGTHVNGIENFWSFAKRRLAKFNGVSRKTFLLHLKETEFRYNHRGDMLKQLERIMKDLLV